MELSETIKSEYETLIYKYENLVSSYESLKSEHEALKFEHEALKGVIVALTGKVADLEAKRNKNSTNSNKPPSSDNVNKKPVKNNRFPSGRQTGGQPGHEGKTRPLSSSPDTVVKIKPREECECGGQILINDNNYIVKQVTDIERPKMITVEYQAFEGICKACGKVHKASFPEGVKGVVSYGDNIQAIAAYLTTYQLIPLKRATELIEDLFGIKMSQATILASNQKAYENLAEPERQIKDEIINSDVAGFDETGLRVMGENFWLHVASTTLNTYYSVQRKRGQEAMDNIGILPVFRGTAIHDHWKSYYKYLCAHGECNAHHIRQLLFIYEELGCNWAMEMICLLLKIKLHVDITKLFKAEGQEVNSLEQADIEIYEKAYRKILADAQLEIEKAKEKEKQEPEDESQEEPPIKVPKESQRMVKRLTEYEQEALLFMYDFSVPFTNNLSERDLRMPKAHQKISGGFRTENGADVFARVRGFVSTVKKRGKNVFDGMAAIFKNNSKNFIFEESL